ncbi:MAG TPA: NAD(P)-binding protein [Thermoanaerobaculia bacterium]|nr:NAD(P)-binding protein [Thermoanaerobaculia bacterium]
MSESRCDVVILGAGLAGLSLARHLLMETERSVLLLERRDRIPPDRQKVGESLVQLAGYYFSKVLDMEEYLLREHYPKYNLRFYWKTPGRGNARFEDYSQSYIRSMSNVPSYQLDRNKIEGELLRRNLESPRFTFEVGVKTLEVQLTEGELPHRVSYANGGERREVTASWVVDTTGRGRYLAKRLEIARTNPIRHGAFFWWVEGLVDIDKLTDRSPREIRLKPERRHQGHLPVWLATNHFCGEGLWFWVIPLQGKTSLGLVFDNRLIDPSEVFSVEKAQAWVCREFPLFARDLPHRKVLDFAGFRDFSHDCAQTISPDRWALAGEAGRFTDPLYSPGSDLISLYNTLIVAAIETREREELLSRCRQAEQLMRAVYSAYVPSYAVSYDALGDQEVFSLKYTWELTVYFAGYVFPFINDLFADRRFGLAFLRLFSRLGPLNRAVQQMLSDYYQWKKASGRLAGEQGEAAVGPVFFDFTEIGSLREAERTFYEIGVTVEEARRVLARQVGNLQELARFLVAHVASSVLGNPRVVRSRRFVEGIDLEAIRFEPESWAARWAECRDGAGGGEAQEW